MRDYVEIGIGREARRTYSLDEIGIVASRRTRSSKDVDTHWHVDAYTFDIPFVSHPTDALAGPEFVIEMGRLGGLGVINAEGLWGRHEDLAAAVELVRQAPNKNKVLQELHAKELDLGLLTDRIAQVREAGNTVAVRVSPQNARELAPVVIKAGAEILFIQGTLISAEHVQAGSPLNLKNFVDTLDVPVIAGGVTDYTTATHLMRSGVVGVIVGGGEHTGYATHGIRTPMATAIADVAAARRDYLDETGGRYVHILADGEINSSGNAVKAFACGADAVILGEPLAGASEALGGGYYWPSVAAHPHSPRGLVTESFTETHSLDVILNGPSTAPLGGLNYVGALARAMAKCGYTDLKSFQKVPLNVIQ
ncbi:MAG: GuaB3 family IMP dehydrogenase-related protein [Corynebacterium sp.]|nr:GuaB3 family IMP dehydrogenase-related protein [Corynebacterium sp.]